MPDIFGLDIAGIVNDSLEAAGGLVPAVLIKVTPGVVDPAARTSGAQPTTQELPCKGVIEDYTAYEVAQGLVQAGERRILLLARSIEGGAVPAPNDQIRIEDSTYRIGEGNDAVKRDPAAATYICRSRK
jgi:hypothetical protein